MTSFRVDWEPLDKTEIGVADDRQKCVSLDTHFCALVRGEIRVWYARETMTPELITVSVGGGHELERAGLVALITSIPGLRVVPIENRPSPQVLVWLTCRDIVKFPDIPSGTSLLLLTENAEYESLPETVTGLFSRNESTAALSLAIRQVARGEQYLSPSLAAAILAKRQSKSAVSHSEKSVIDMLTEREREILDLLAQDLSNKMIASRLYLSVRTVEGHLANIYLRLGVHSRTEAMLLAVRIR